MNSVDRLEEFQPGAVEHSGGSEVVQYRGKILPLLRLAELLGLPTGETPGVLPVIVSSKQGRSVGLVVDNIEDVTEKRVAVNRTGHRMYLQGSAVLQQKVTDLLDVDAVIASLGSECEEAVYA